MPHHAWLCMLVAVGWGFGCMETIILTSKAMPDQVLPLLHATARDTVLEEFPDFGTIHADIFVRFPELGYTESIRNLRCCCGPSLTCAIPHTKLHCPSAWPRGCLQEGPPIIGRHTAMLQP